VAAGYAENAVAGLAAWSQKALLLAEAGVFRVRAPLPRALIAAAIRPVAKLEEALVLATNGVTLQAADVI
jgi:hypothetical protein